MISLLLLALILQANANITDRQIVEYVISQFPGVQVAQDEIRMAQGENQFAEGAFDIVLQTQATQSTGDYDYKFLNTRIVKPTSLFGLDLYGGFKKSLGTIPVYDGQLETLDRGEFSVGAKLPLLRGFLIDERRAQLKKNQWALEQRKFQLRSVELEQVRLALHRYWDWRLSQQRLVLQKSLLEIAETRNTWLQKRTKAGDIARFELDDNQRTILQRKSTVLQAEQVFAQSSAELGYYISDSPFASELDHLPTAKTFLFSLPTETNQVLHNQNDLLNQALQNRPELKALSAQKEQLRVDEELQSNRWWPQMDLEAQYSKDRGFGSSTLDDENLKLNLNLEIPLQYRRIRGRGEQIQGSISRLRHQNMLLEQRIKADIQQLQKALSVALERRQLAESEIKLAHQLEAGERQRLKQGETNILTVNLREQASAEAELRYMETSVEALKSYISLKTTIGSLPL